MGWQQRYLERFYSRARGWRDGTEEFHELCTTVIPPGARILELGAGRDNHTSSFLAQLGCLQGLDPDPLVLTNPALTSAAVLRGSRFPFEDMAFDACVSNYVVEHVEDPVSHLSEAARVLKPSGVYVFRTPNRYHYVAVASALTPHWIHERLANQLRGLATGSGHPHRTFYRLNSRGAIRRRADQAGLVVEELRMIEKEPSYGFISPVLFLSFMAYERVVNSSPVFAGLRANILAVLRRTT